MTDDTLPSAAELKQKIEFAVVEEAVKAAVDPSLANRFEVLPSSVPDHVVLVLANHLVLDYETDGEPSITKQYMNVKIHSATLISRSVGMNLIAKLSAALSRDVDSVQEDAPESEES